jgi:hypothetical protein
MRMIVPRLSGFCSKVLEVIGAGLASAIGAFLLSQIVSKPAAAPPPEPRMVRIVPADAETMRLVRSEQAALTTEIQKASDSQTPPEAVTATTPAPTRKAAAAALPRPAKTAQAPTVLREPKMDAARPAPASYRAATVEPMPIHPVSAAAVPPAQPVSPVVENAEPPAEATNDGRFRILSTLRQVPGWFLPDTEKLFGDAPRPPMPVGQFVSRAM